MKNFSVSKASSRWQSGNLPVYVHQLMALAQEDSQLQNLLPDLDIESELATPGLMFRQAIATVLDGYASRPALGERDYKIVRDPMTGRAIKQYQPAFHTITYAELRHRVEAIARAWQYLDNWEVNTGDFVCILGFNGIDYVTIDLACLYMQGVSVPLQRTMGAQALKKIFTDTNPTIVSVTVKDAEFVANLVATQKSVRMLILLDYDRRVDDDCESYAAVKRILFQSDTQAQLITITELISYGEAIEWKPLPPINQDMNRVAMLMHSSGTTGIPKGAIFFDRHARSSLAPAAFIWPRVRLCFVSMNHTMGRGTVYGTIAHGGSVYFSAKSDMSTFFDDIGLVRPTDGFFFPRALEMIYNHYKNLVALGMDRGELSNTESHAKVLVKMRNEVLGGRLCMIKGGSAVTLPEVRQFLTNDLQIEFIDRYGSTEAGNITVNNRIRRPSVIDYRLRDVPELGFFKTDKPFPRGELCVKTAYAIPGYFKHPELSANLFDSDGFILTGDIMEEREPDYLVYIDRRNDVLKLTQGEFVAAGSLGSIFENYSEIIWQMYVYANSNRAYLLAVVVPNMKIARMTLGHDPDEAELRSMIKDELKRVGTLANLKDFELPRDFIIEMEPFSQENDLLTTLQKPIRPALHRKYSHRLEQLYNDLKHKQVVGLDALRSGFRGSVIEKIGKALEATLSIDYDDVNRSKNFADLGGDSIAAVEFSVLLEQIFGVEIPVNSILSSTGSPKKWARWIESALIDGSSLVPTFAVVHGKGEKKINAADLTTLLDTDVSYGAPVSLKASAPPTVLLTGATGFLGRFLCIEWLELLADEGGKLICLVRAPDNASATQRLKTVFTGVDTRYMERFHMLAKNHLEVIAGDITEVSLGISASDYARFEIEVDRIVHSAALVNHVLDYEHLFSANVAGTAALINLSIAKRLKRFDFVSSNAISRLLDRRDCYDEESPLLARVNLGQDYANGYVTSKWAAEHLLRLANDRFGLPVNVFRATMLLPHRSFHGQINLEDIFTRLLYSVIITGIAPASFYMASSDGSRAKAHYDGLPVDFVATAIAQIGTIQRSDDLHIFNVHNQHYDDGLSLDVFVDWIVAAGYPVTRLSDYEEWLLYFEEKLRLLPECLRRLSLLPVLYLLRKPLSVKPAAYSQNFDKTLRKLDIGPETPHLTRDYIEKFLKDLHRYDLIPMKES